MTTEQFIELFENDNFKKAYMILIKNKNKVTDKTPDNRTSLEWATDNFITLIDQDLKNKELKFEKITKYIKYLRQFELHEVCEYLNSAKHKFRKQKLEKLNALQSKL
jgi:hypothetical protein